jgi:class 3 adenylate cyclase
LASPTFSILRAPIGELAVTETESRPRNRALVASFLFTDLVGYSKGTASDQYAAKVTLSEILGRNLAALDKDDYRIKDTGDGALIAFLSNPEHALYMALAIAHDFARAASVAGFPSNNVRTGLHIGAVKEAIDLEARPNFVGDGINAAKRIMDFAAPGQITASRAYFEAVSWLDSAYAALFQHLGASDDKHGRPHELYAIAPSDAVLERLRLDLASNAARDPKEVDRGALSPREKSGERATIASDTATAASAKTASARRWFFPAATLIGVAVVASIVVLWPPQKPVGVIPQSAEGKGDPAALPAASSRQSAPTSVARPADVQTTTPSKSDSEPSATVPSKADAATAPPAAQPRAMSSVRPNATNAGVDTQRKATEPPAAAATASAPASPASARCRHILEKVQIGEPLSQDEKRELANSCR